MHVLRRMPVLLVLLILSPSCSGGGSGSLCLAGRPIFVSTEDRLTAETARALLAHNETGARLCGWSR